jgi:hypothetical protein
MKLRIVFATLILLGVCSGVSMRPAKVNLTANLSFGGGGLPTPCDPPSGGAAQGFPCLFTK